MTAASIFYGGRVRRLPHLFLANRSIFSGGHKLRYMYNNYIHTYITEWHSVYTMRYKSINRIVRGTDNIKIARTLLNVLSLIREQNKLLRHQPPNSVTYWLRCQKKEIVFNSRLHQPLTSSVELDNSVGEFQSGVVVRWVDVQRRRLDHTQRATSSLVPSP